MDSAVTLAEAKAARYAPYALSFRYGQRASAELVAARRVVHALGAVEHRVVTIDLAEIGGSALTDDIAVPRHRTEQEIATGVPPTYVPARNTIFLAVALGWAEVLGARDLFLGVNAIDYSGYPDCRPAFLDAFQDLAQVATAAGVEEEGPWRVHAPLLELSKADIVRRAEELGVDLGLTLSCYDPVAMGGRTLACGACDACLLRLRGFREAGKEDPVEYVEEERGGAGTGTGTGTGSGSGSEDPEVLEAANEVGG